MRQLVFCGLLLLNFFQDTPTSAINLFSIDEDIEIGAEAARQADKSLPLVNDAGALGYFRELGMRLVRSSSVRSMQYRFRIINSREGDSVTYPGGAIYIDRRLIELTGNEHELAAILAHEIAHANARHGTEQLSRQLLVQSPASIVAGFLAREGWKEQLSNLGMSFGARGPFVRYTEAQEMEANSKAVEILAKSGYSPHALSSVLEKINSSRVERTGLPAYAYHHPQGEQAVNRLESELGEQKAPARPPRPTAAFRSFQASLAKVAPPAEDVAPADNAVLTGLYTHPAEYYRLRYPEGWQVSAYNVNGAKIAPPGGIQTSRAVNNARPGGIPVSRTVDNVGIGVVVDIASIDRAMTLEQATDRLIVQWRESNQSPVRDPSVGYMPVPGAQLQILMGSEPALRTVMIGRPSASQPMETVWMVTRRYYENLFYIVCVAPYGEEFSKYQPVFEQIIRSVELRER